VFDILTIAALADELTDRVLDGRIQRIGHLDARTIAAEIYAGRRRHYLIASADTHRPRIYLSEVEPSFDTQLVTPFSQLLRKHARGGHLVGIEQPPLERILRLSIAKRQDPHNGGDRRAETEELSLADAVEPSPDDDDEDGLADATFVHLVVEIMGRHSNIVLVDDGGRILQSVKRVTSSMSRVRPILPRLPYRDPPPIDRPDPRRLTAGELTSILAGADPKTKLATVLTGRLRSISPQMAREIAFQVSGDANVAVDRLGPDEWAAIARETRRLFEPLLTSAWQPSVYRDDDAVVAFAAVPMRHLAAGHREESVPSISRAAELAETGGEATPVRHAQRRQRLVRSIGVVRDRARSRLASIREQGAKADEADRLRQWGELIYAYLWSIEPGQTELLVDGAAVPLDPLLSAKENAQGYFERYRKAQSAGSHLPDLLAKAEQEIAYLDQLRTQIEQAERFDDLETLGMEWEAYQVATGRGGARPAQKRSTPTRKPRALLDDRGNAIYVGRSGADNDAVTFDLAGPNDTWLHARGVPGSHVIVRWHDPAGTEDEETLGRAAALAAFYSSARASGTVEVDATRRRYVRKIKGAGPGMVTYRNERTLAAKPKDETALGLATPNRRTG
jgi:predicted ribosome quality control (RQC) complex YloA/Tae2 family protein